MCYRMCFCFKQKTAYEMRISDWSSDVCSSDLSGIQTSGRMVGYWPTDAFQRFDDDDILRLRPTEYGAITGTEELGPGFGSDGAVWVAESGTIRYVAEIGRAHV